MPPAVSLSLPRCHLPSPRLRRGVAGRLPISTAMPPAACCFPIYATVPPTVVCLRRDADCRVPVSSSPPVNPKIPNLSASSPTPTLQLPGLIHFTLKEVAFDIKLPRRSLLVEFTCDSCGERTKRLINRVAYEKGTVFLQCAGCLVYHKFVDNLGLVVEYNLREELNEDSDVT